jgi:hypothetical protein
MRSRTASNIENQQGTGLKALQVIPGVGPSLARDLWNIGIHSVDDLRGRDPEILYGDSNRLKGMVQDRCVLYVFRCAVYFAETKRPDTQKLQWWWWKDKGHQGKEMLKIS